MHEILDWLPVPDAQGVMAFDPTFFIAWPLFVLLMLVLWQLLLQPYAKILEERDKLTEGTKAAATEMEAQAADTLSRYETELKAARNEAAELREGLRRSGSTEQEEALTAARRETDAMIASRREAIQAQHTAAMAEVSSKVDELATSLVDRLLAKPQARRG